ncbi:hypothetical protein FQN57_004203 [Myotisia sp. PD_48]|nr:hypothetical protein FQN57_004203 [Myotisia sp. PD_48]
MAASKPVESSNLQTPYNHLPLSILAPGEQQRPLVGAQPTNSFDPTDDDGQKPIPGDPNLSQKTLGNMMDALDVMQSEYFEIWKGTWPSGIDWTRAVLATQVSAALSALCSTDTRDLLKITISSTIPNASSHPNGTSRPELINALVHENLINYYFQHIAAFWFGEDFFGIRLQAYDDMLWVVLEWLESIKFQELHSKLHYQPHSTGRSTIGNLWHGTQFRIPAGHRSRVFHRLASKGWNTTLCEGGMIWSPWLTPYKNAITNQLYISASIGMYLYFPGDNIDAPVATGHDDDGCLSPPHDPAHLNAAIDAYVWLKNSKMTGRNGLYGDGFHVRGWSPNDPGTRKCDVYNSMVYTYNQGVILSGLRGLWFVTGSSHYLEDGHQLLDNVIRATGWPHTSDQRWQGLGRGGVLEEACDSSGTCSQNGHTFKGIFFHHFAEFCRPFSPQEEHILRSLGLPERGNDSTASRRADLTRHLQKCSSYRRWIEHNANAALMTRNEKGKFGMWWGRKYPDITSASVEPPVLPPDSVDYINADPPVNSGDPYSEMLWNGGSGQEGVHRSSGGTTRRFPDQQSVHAQERDHSPNRSYRDVNDRGRGRTVETQSGGLAVLRALYQWETVPELQD